MNLERNGEKRSLEPELFGWCCTDVAEKTFKVAVGWWKGILLQCDRPKWQCNGWKEKQGVWFHWLKARLKEF